jgi:hypothetical protein
MGNAIGEVAGAVPLFGPALKILTKFIPFGKKKKKKRPGPAPVVVTSTPSEKEEEEEEESEEDAMRKGVTMGSNLETEMDGDTLRVSSPEFQHFAFLPQLAAAAGESALNWLGNKAMSLFSKKEEPEEEREEEEDSLCDESRFNSLDIQYDEEDGSFSMYVPQVANMTDADQNEFISSIATDFMGMFGNLLGKGAEAVSSYFGSRAKPPTIIQAPPSQQRRSSGGADVSEEEEEEEDASNLLPAGDRFALRAFRRHRRHRKHHGRGSAAGLAGLGNIRDAANGR